MDVLVKSLTGLNEAIGGCLERKQFLPALILIYAGIDIVASAERHQSEGTKASFTRWVDSYLSPNKALGCTAVELYAARCGILHTSTADSNLSRAGKARKIYYAWGNASASDLSETANRLGTTDVVAVHIGELRDAFRQAALKWTAEVLADPVRRKRVGAASDSWFGNMSTQVVKEFLRRTN